MSVGPVSRRWAALLLAVLAGTGCSGPGDDGDGFSREPYLGDLARLEAFTAAAYANLEWAVTEGGVDPVAVHREARRAILAATSDEEAVAALHGFVDAFADGHFRLRPAAEPAAAGSGDATPAPGPETPPREACARLGYEEHDQSFRLDLGGSFRAITAADDPFPAGLLEIGGTAVGIVRIDEFGANRFGEYCPESWQAYRRGLGGPCDDWPCEYGFRLVVVDRLLDEIAARIRALESSGVTALVVDVTGNGGGSDWVHPAAAMLTEKELVGNGRSVIRHPHWRGIFQEMTADVEQDLAREDLSAGQRRLLAEVRGRLLSGIEEASGSCDLSSIWEQGAHELPCSLLVREKLYTTGLLAGAPAVDTEGLASGPSLYKALDYGERPVAWRGALALLMDRDTASATELFAALLRDNEAATLIGERTFGVGCGYSNGGVQTMLERSRLEVWLPDCVRHRRDGGSERAGIKPDLAVDRVDGETAQQRGERFRERIGGWVAGL